mmetsp:Transcript_82561/g.242262  ORF Transcript_82561/g.242262 Transcript_82561/m.242262 type:complete len:297 (-) Transcript_82561:63-953(-)
MGATPSHGEAAGTVGEQPSGSAGSSTGTPSETRPGEPLAYLAPASKPGAGPGPEVDFLRGLGETFTGQLPSFLTERLFNFYPVPEALQRENYSRTVNVAVTGTSGVGKSLFVNNVRGIKHGDPAWAPVGVSETTAKPTPYPFPGEPRVRLWDMEGASTTCTSDNMAEEYIHKVGLRYFDVVLVLSARRFTEVECEIVKELRQLEIPHFFVRTKLDVDIMNNLADNRMNREETAQSIREDLDSCGIGEPYLINVREVTAFDFPRLYRDVLLAIADPLHEMVTNQEEALEKALQDGTG